MNLTSIIALLELKGVISRAEGEKLVEHINNKPQSVSLSDAVDQVKELLKDGEGIVTSLIDAAKPAIEKVASEVKADVTKIAEEAKADVQAIANEVTDDVTKVLEESTAIVKKATDTAKKK